MRFDDSCFPIVFREVPSKVSLEQVAEFENGYEMLFARRAKFVVVADLRGIQGIPDAALRRGFADVMNRDAFQSRLREYQVASACIVRSPVLLATLTALFWLSKPPIPVLPFTERDVAVRWAIDALRVAGVPLAPEIEQRVRASA